MLAPAGIRSAQFQALNKLKMGTLLCDVTMTLKRQEKIGNILFLKQNTFFYKKMYVWHFYPKILTGLHSSLHYKTDALKWPVLKSDSSNSTV